MYVGFQATLPHKYIVFCPADICMSWLAANRHRPQQPSCPGLSVFLVLCSTSTSRLQYSWDSGPVAKRFRVKTWRSISALNSAIPTSVIGPPAVCMGNVDPSLMSIFWVQSAHVSKVFEWWNSRLSNSNKYDTNSDSFSKIKEIVFLSRQLCDEISRTKSF